MKPSLNLKTKDNLHVGKNAREHAIQVERKSNNKHQWKQPSDDTMIGFAEKMKESERLISASEICWQE
jgi:hypothetical protein